MSDHDKRARIGRHLSAASGAAARGVSCAAALAVALVGGIDGPGAAVAAPMSPPGSSETACTMPVVTVPNNSLTATTPIGKADFVTLMLTIHNDARAEWGVPALVWDEGLAMDSAAWSQWLLDNNNGTLEHYFPALDRVKGVGLPKPGAKGYFGENLAGGNQYSAGAPEANLANLWLTEKAVFCQNVYRNGKWTGDTQFQNAGHYSQVIWRNTTKVGCGLATKVDRRVLTCRYRLGGNANYDPVSAVGNADDFPLDPTQERTGAAAETSSALRMTLLTLNNTFRAKKGLAPLTWDAALAQRGQAEATRVIALADPGKEPWKDGEIRGNSAKEVWDSDFYYNAASTFQYPLGKEWSKLPGTAEVIKVGCGTATIQRAAADPARPPSNNRVVSCFYAGNAPAAAVSSATDSTSADPGFQSAIMARINALRAVAKVTPLTWSDDLAKAAATAAADRAKLPAPWQPPVVAMEMMGTAQTNTADAANFPTSMAAFDNSLGMDFQTGRPLVASLTSVGCAQATDRKGTTNWRVVICRFQ